MTLNNRNQSNVSLLQVIYLLYNRVGYLMLCISNTNVNFPSLKNATADGIDVIIVYQKSNKPYM